MGGACKLKFGGDTCNTNKGGEQMSLAIYYTNFGLISIRITLEFSEIAIAFAEEFFPFFHFPLGHGRVMLGG